MKKPDNTLNKLRETNYETLKKNQTRYKQINVFLQITKVEIIKIV